MSDSYDEQIRELSAKNAALLQQVAAVQEAHEKIKAQLPDEMQECTIRYKECTTCQRGWLQPDNWVDHGCPHCARDAVDRKLTMITCHRDELLENARNHESRMAAALHYQFVALDQLNNIKVDYAKLQRQYDRVVQSFRHLARPQTVEGPVAADAHGPIYKDELCPEALRDGYLRRSAESKAKRTATPPKQEGDVGIEFTAENQCTRKGCPTDHPHRHITHGSDPLVDRANQIRNARAQATVDDEQSQSSDPDVVYPKTNPNITKTVADYGREKFASQAEQRRAKGALRDSALVSSHPNVPLADASGEAGPHVGAIIDNDEGNDESFALPPGKVLFHEAVDDALIRAEAQSDETLNTPDNKMEDR